MVALARCNPEPRIGDFSAPSGGRSGNPPRKSRGHNGLPTWRLDAAEGPNVSEYVDGTHSQDYVYGMYVDDPLAVIQSGGTRYHYHCNSLYSIAAMTDSSGIVVERYGYSAYGGRDVVVDEPTLDQPYGFTGRRLDDETGLWYFRARYYDDELGRFTARDPIGYVDGLNAYRAYFSINGLDPTGLWLSATPIFGGPYLSDAALKAMGWIKTSETTYDVAEWKTNLVDERVFEMDEIYKYEFFDKSLCFCDEGESLYWREEYFLAVDVKLDFILSATLKERTFKGRSWWMPLTALIGYNQFMWTWSMHFDAKFKYTVTPVAELKDIELLCLPDTPEDDPYWDAWKEVIDEYKKYKPTYDEWKSEIDAIKGDVLGWAEKKTMERVKEQGLGHLVNQ